MEKPLVSILMTVYNRERYLPMAIESVLASSYMNWELIIVDDQSKDQSLKIAQNYSESDTRIKVFQNEKNLGQFKNRNKAAEYSEGKYLKYVDSDDYIYPWGLELLVQMMEQNPAAGWGLCTLEQDDRFPFPKLLSSKEAFEYHFWGPGLFHKAPLSSIIHKDAFWAVNGFSIKPLVGDTDMWYKLAKKYPVLLMPQGIVWYREHDDQEVNSYFKFIREYEQVMIDHITAEDCPLDDRQKKGILKNQRSKIVKSILKNILLRRFRIVYYKIKQLMVHFK